MGNIEQKKAGKAGKSHLSLMRLSQDWGSQQYFAYTQTLQTEYFMNRHSFPLQTTTTVEHLRCLPSLLSAVGREEN